MNALSKLIASIAALIVSLAFMWITLVITGVASQHQVKINVGHEGTLNLVAPFGGFGQ
jgi:hypothetical protein